MHSKSSLLLLLALALLSSSAVAAPTDTDVPEDFEPLADEKPAPPSTDNPPSAQSQPGPPSFSSNKPFQRHSAKSFRASSSAVSGVSPATLPKLQNFFQSLRIHQDAMTPQCTRFLGTSLFQSRFTNHLDNCPDSSPFFATPRDLCSPKCLPSLIFLSQSVSFYCPISSNPSPGSPSRASTGQIDQSKVYQSWSNPATANLACSPGQGDGTSRFLLQIVHEAYDTFLPYHDDFHSSSPSSTSSSSSSFSNSENYNVPEIKSKICTRDVRTFVFNIKKASDVPMLYFYTMPHYDAFVKTLKSTCGIEWYHGYSSEPNSEIQQESSSNSDATVSNPWIERPKSEPINIPVPRPRSKPIPADTL
ncbi:hypothetical protein BKA69DRAFT_1040959 [Paraphysoderma sedebokerense]|nr:hypothetical protein BKA69DRAFT_1040959 [Paraphysoderma sedebokerense]